MKMNEILNTIKNLSYSQGFYGRLYRQLMDIKNNDIEAYNNIVNELENKNFSDPIDLVLFFEC